MQRGFTKLFNTIVTSTIWQEDDKTRIVWITMLAIADAFGNVFAAIPGLASVANVSIEAAEKAVKNLLAPDPYSRTKDHEGRRIEVIDGGWHIINYGKYRKMMDEEERRDYKAKWARESRRQKRTNIDKSGQSGHIPSASASSSVLKKGETEGEVTTEDIYAAYPLKKGKPVALRAIKQAISRGTSPVVLLERTQAFADARNGDVSYCPNPATWFNQERFNDDPDTWMPQHEGKEPAGRRTEPSEFQQRDSKINELNRRKQAMLREHGDKVYGMREFEQIDKQLMSL